MHYLALLCLLSADGRPQEYRGPPVIVGNTITGVNGIKLVRLPKNTVVKGNTVTKPK